MSVELKRNSHAVSKKNGDIYCVSYCGTDGNDLENGKNVSIREINANHCIYSTSQMYEIDRQTMESRLPINSDTNAIFYNGKLEKEYILRHKDENSVIPISNITIKTLPITITLLKHFQPIPTNTTITTKTLPTTTTTTTKTLPCVPKTVTITEKDTVTVKEVVTVTVTDHSAEPTPVNC
ncbi:hypothetical protein PIROE2DRAFT_11491 [Piromyces sp. E2]|nr:hypothetical protein PIROE2DRAFT_11491 [Piromyces sp. E2]|eukprot:OUM62287.1 hypothetical protein PIROE2DRAFT_11491 [Piromyces sp. E2]